MIRNFVLLFVFLAALSMVNAFQSQLVKRQASFGRCPLPVPQDIPIITNITLNPDPPIADSQVEVKGSAMTNNDIVNDTFFTFVIFNESITIFAKPTNICNPFRCPTKTISAKPTDICDPIKCPTKVFNFDIKYYLDVGFFPSSYTILVLIGPQSPTINDT
ncbi:18813_t:CDS:1, partial [Racocetra persica]